MSHANARLNLHGRRLLVERVLGDGRPVAHVAKELGVSRQCAHRWVARFRAEGDDGSAGSAPRDRCAVHAAPRLRSSPGYLELRRASAAGQDWLGPELGSRPERSRRSCAGTRCPTCGVRPVDRRTSSGHRRPPRSATNATSRDRWCTWMSKNSAASPMAAVGEPTGASMDRPAPRSGPRSASTTSTRSSTTTPGSPTPRSSPTRRAPPAPAFLLRAAAYFTDHGIARIEQVMTDNHFSYKRSHDVAEMPSPYSAPRTCSSARTALGKTAKSNATTAPCRPSGPTGRSSSATPNAPHALAPWLEHYNTRRRHSAIGGHPRSADCHQRDCRVHLAV